MDSNSNNFELAKKYFLLGTEYHEKKSYAEAEHYYLLSLEYIPNRISTLNNLSAILIKSGKLESAEKLINKIIEINPSDETVYLNQGQLFEKTKDWIKSIASYDKVIKINPSNSEAYICRGLVFQNLKFLEKALDSFNNAINSDENNIIAKQHKEIVLQLLNFSDEKMQEGAQAAQNEQFEKAYKLLNQSIETDAENIYAYNNIGNVLQELDKLHEALSNYDKAIKIKNDYADAYLNRGNVLKKLKRYEEALISYEKTIDIDNTFAEVFSNRGVVLKELKRFEEALESYDKAIELKSDYAEAYYNRSGVLKEINRLEEAILNCDKAIKINPNFEEAYSNRGVLLKEINRWDEALSSCNKAIEINPDYADAYNNRGVVLHDMKHINEALQNFDKAIELKPNYAEAYWNQSLSLLLKGELINGFIDYEWRWKLEKNKLDQRIISKPLWLGKDSLKGKTILLHSEQGLGDSIQFCRYASLVKNLGAKVLLEIPEHLTHLLKNLDGVDILIEKGNSLPSFDYHCPLMSLPIAFNTELNSVPNSDAYLKASEAKIEIWSKLLGLKTKTRIGLVWSGNANHKNDRNRTISLQELVEILPTQLEFICLQKEIRINDKENLENSCIKHYEKQIIDFSDTAALCHLMDLVICVDTSAAHLAGAMGKPTWILLPYVPDWRWLLDRDDSPWYNSVKLYRQNEDRAWAPVLELLVGDLNTKFSS